MSWDILAIDLPPGLKSLDDLPDEYQPGLLGRRSVIIARIKAAIPTADFGDPAWGIVQGPGWHIEVNIGADEECKSFMLHVRGGDEVVAVVATILDSVGVVGVDGASEGGLFNKDAALASFRRWKGYRDHVAGALNDAGVDEDRPPRADPGPTDDPEDGEAR